MTKEEAIRWLKLDIEMMKFDPTTGEDAYLNDDAKKTLEALEMAIEALSAEPKKGEWIKTENVGRFLDTLWECSECGCAHADNIFCISGDFNFCPNCGADMREGKEWK